MRQRTSDRAGRARRALLAGLAAALAAAAAPAAGDPALNTRYGDPATSLTPEVDAMAGTGAALYRGGFSNLLNPAFLTEEEGARGDAAMSLTQVHEDRFQPLYDTFGSYVTDTAIASNRHHQFGAGFAAAWRLPVTWRPVTAALSLADRYAFAYDFQEQVRDPDPNTEPSDLVIEDRSVEIDGALRALSAGTAVELSPGFSLGVAAHYCFGSRDQVSMLRSYTSPSSSVREESTYEMAGLNFTFGARLRVNERLTLGAAYESPAGMTGDTETRTVSGAYPDSVLTVAGTAGVDYPHIWRAGLAYHPRSDPQTVFTVEAAIAQWPDLDDSRVSGNNPLLLQDALDVRIGLEHRFYNGVPVRFGFRRLDSYEDPEVGASFFTAGVGMPAAGGEIALSAGLSKTTSIREHWFAYPVSASYVADDQSRVEDTRLRVGVGFTRSF